MRREEWEKKVNGRWGDTTSREGRGEDQAGMAAV